ncbi:hypothetical protein SPRG_06415 [Saprolegnia parasitica CBS 223.65]|uniref:Uncharacterized protein n=1 Tax=Saprolegnia parasitica (strain CBS 223.65) TaxID=695850 RepID=A0A067CP12_SAPPC|nr:hypothetical protein SPRG_06415 [Saprolegnia parasitica CBS 223.65]KDO28557.1 hypothetical protein SPRG_06415 [Saprolegnia parasitica CBS 223.65]|eukprot:XP_012200622.1 hypothetical protein SPRG_06415 [Saprolegnia parasitica CBS 223.65]
MDEAAANGHLEVVTFLHVHRHEACTEEAMDDAATHGHLNVVQFLHENRTEGCTMEALDGAIGNGYLGVVEYLYGLGQLDCTADAVDRAASRGHLEVLKFVLSNRMDAGTRDLFVQYALEGGHVRTAEYLLSLGYPFPTFEIEFEDDVFCKPEILGVFRLLDTHGDIWDDAWMEQACAANNVPLVQVLLKHANGRCGPDALEAAVSNKAWDVVRFLLANETDNISMNALQTLLQRGNLDIAVHILQRHPELRHEKLLQAASAGHNTAATRFLLASGIGKPRECLFEIAGRPKHVTESKLLLPYCMEVTKHLDNVLYRLKLYKIPGRRRKTTLQLITQELTYQARKLSQTITMAPSVAVRAATLLQSGDVVDWALALIIGHLHATDAAATVKQLEKKASLVEDAELKTQLHRLLASKRKRQESY